MAVAGILRTLNYEALVNGHYLVFALIRTSGVSRPRLGASPCQQMQRPLTLANNATRGHIRSGPDDLDGLGNRLSTNRKPCPGPSSPPLRGGNSSSIAPSLIRGLFQLYTPRAAI